MRYIGIVLLVLFACFAINNAVQVKPKIANGFLAKPEQFPFFAFLALEHSSGVGGGCGASLISDEWLLTAAHCLRGIDRLTVILGVTDLLDPNHPGRVAIDVDKNNFYSYFWYFSPMTWNDIALIRLPRKVEFSQYIQPVQLPTECASPENVEAYAIGNGAISNFPAIASRQLYAHLKTTPMDVCKKVYPILWLRKSVICAYSNNYYQSVCPGDSGGPLVNLNNTLIGVTDFMHGLGCERGLPQGFTNIYSYMNWIKKKTGLDLPKC